MGLLFRLAELLIVILPLAGVVIAAVKAFSASQRRARTGSPDSVAAVESPGNRVGSQGARWASIKRVVEEHSRTDERWLDYELDLTKLLDFPLMTDMCNPLTASFHTAKLKADFLRPAKAEDLLEDREAAVQYLAAVQEYVTAFDVAESEAIRRRRNDFSQDAQQRIARAQSLFRVASDSAATAQERRQAYDVASKELDGLIVLPAAAQKTIERRISGEIDG